MLKLVIVLRCTQVHSLLMQRLGDTLAIVLGHVLFDALKQAFC